MYLQTAVRFWNNHSTMFVICLDSQVKPFAHIILVLLRNYLVKSKYHRGCGTPIITQHKRPKFLVYSQYHGIGQVQ